MALASQKACTSEAYSKTDDNLIHAFCWEISKEGHHFWNDIWAGGKSERDTSYDSLVKIAEKYNIPLSGIVDNFQIY